jgi:serine/threonine protein kinase
MPTPVDLTRSFADTVQIWDALADRIEAFVTAWESGDPPRLAEHVPEGPRVVRKLALFEMIKVDLEYRWKGDEGRYIEDYAREFPEIADAGVPCDLIYEEFHIRRLNGREVAAEEYFERFPDQADELRRLLGLESAHVTTTMFSRSRADELDTGQTVDDFDLLTRLGRGAFASVFLARQRSMQRMVALKVSADRGHEPQTLAQLDHPNIVRVYDQRILADRGLRLLYMQYVNGGALADTIDYMRQVPVHERTGRTLLAAIDQSLDRRGETPPVDSNVRQRLGGASWPEVVCWIGMQLASALDYAHRRQVLHRDLKPANILLAADGTPKLVDFNISYCSKLTGATPASYFGGSLAYMSPEQLEACNPKHARAAESLDERSDLYSLGVLLWELLTGSRPFRDELSEAGGPRTLESMVERRRAGVPAEARARVPANCPEELADVLVGCLSPDAAGRFASGAEVARQLRVCVQPAARKLLRPAGRGWVYWVRRFPFAAVFTLALAPNALAGYFNYVYNHSQIINRVADAQATFWTVVYAVNAVAFPLGIVIIGSLVWPVVRGMRTVFRGRLLDEAALPKLRTRALTMGRIAAVVSIVEWLIAGVVYPAAIQAAGAPLSGTDYAHFIGSLALCGLIAAAYPFFGITAVSVRAFYPGFIRPGSLTAADVAQMATLHRRTWWYLAAAVSLPLLGVMILVGIGGAENRSALGLLSAVGLLGAGLTLLLTRMIQQDLAALAELAVDPSDTSLVTTDTVRSFLK